MTDSKNSGGKRKFFVIPQTKETVRSNIILAVGFVLLLAGIALSLKKIFEGSNISIIRPVVLLAFGEICFFIAIAFTKSSLCVSLGLTAVVSAVLAFLMDIGVISLSIKQMWPFSLLVFGIMLIPADFIRYGRLRTVFFVPCVYVHWSWGNIPSVFDGSCSVFIQAFYFTVLDAYSCFSGHRAHTHFYCPEKTQQGFSLHAG